MLFNWINKHKSFYFKTRFWISGSPLLFYSIFNFLKREKSTLTTPATEIVIEGFPRSANTYAVIAFQQSQEQDIQIAHHIHAQAQIIKGVALNIPVCVLIRNPVDAVKSLVIAFPEISFKAGLEAYIKFYSDIYRLRKHYVIATFEEVTTNFGLVIEKINKKFKRSFTVFEDNPENIEKVWTHIKNISNQKSNEQLLAIPKNDKEKLKSKIDIGDCQELLTEAQLVYRNFVDSTL